MCAPNNVILPSNSFSHLFVQKNIYLVFIMAECLGNLFKRESQANKGAVLTQCNKFYLRGRC